MIEKKNFVEKIRIEKNIVYKCIFVELKIL